MPPWPHGYPQWDPHWPNLDEEGERLKELSVWLSEDVQNMAEDLSHGQRLWTPVASTCTGHLGYAESL